MISDGMPSGYESTTVHAARGEAPDVAQDD